MDGSAARSRMRPCVVKPDGTEGSSFIRAGANHGEAKPRRGRSVTTGGNTTARCGSISTKTKALKTERLGASLGIAQKERHEGKPATTSRPGLRGGKKPLKGDPKSATRLKMAGGRGEEEAAERVRNPASGAVAGGLGTAGGTEGASPRTWPLPPHALKGYETPERGQRSRERWRSGSARTVKES